MSTTTLLVSAIIVFVLMLVGIVLTVLEFKYGSPRHQADAARAKSNARKSSARDRFTTVELNQP